VSHEYRAKRTYLARTNHMNQLCPKCKDSARMEINPKTLRYTCSGCKTSWSQNYLAGWNDAYHETAQGIRDALDHLEINKDIDGNIMGESDAANKLRRILANVKVTDGGQEARRSR